MRVGLQGGAEMSVCNFKLNYFVVALNNTSKLLPIANLLQNVSPPQFSKSVLKVLSTGEMLCFLFVNAETFFSSTRTVAVVLLLQITSRIDSQRLLLDEEILSCFLPCVNEIRPCPDLQCPVVTIASYSNYVEIITLILSVHFRSMFNKHCTGFTILNTQTETTMPL